MRRIRRYNPCLPCLRNCLAGRPCKKTRKNKQDMTENRTRRTSIEQTNVITNGRRRTEAKFLASLAGVSFNGATVQDASPLSPPPPKIKFSILYWYLHVFVRVCWWAPTNTVFCSYYRSRGNLISNLAIFLPSNSEASYSPLFRILLVVVIICHMSRHPFLVLFGHSPSPTYSLGDRHPIPVHNLHLYCSM